ncbi:hypothetical protein CBB_1264 [Clostridium botulinum Bf]|uniref:Uncharacterized protein n=1 Tax=Clostridium botulinum (strain 657 / Type Ba4) TaxID=515621 RepID=A0A3F2ZTW7_CLOB6|nr:hypothetical protein CLJ_B1105 [Clostridium botulinum Ba4 str. 657]EDT86013.1 hypothetical protein CBB_1264 [Clostridium botulinum Bf]
MKPNSHILLYVDLNLAYIGNLQCLSSSYRRGGIRIVSYGIKYNLN